MKVKVEIGSQEAFMAHSFSINCSRDIDYKTYLVGKRAKGNSMHASFLLTGKKSVDRLNALTKLQQESEIIPKITVSLVENTETSSPTRSIVVENALFRDIYDIDSEIRLLFSIDQNITANLKEPAMVTIEGKPLRVK